MNVDGRPVLRCRPRSIVDAMKLIMAFAYSSFRRQFHVAPYAVGVALMLIENRFVMF